MYSGSTRFSMYALLHIPYIIEPCNRFYHLWYFRYSQKSLWPLKSCGNRSPRAEREADLETTVATTGLSPDPAVDTATGNTSGQLRVSYRVDLATEGKSQATIRSYKRQRRSNQLQSARKSLIVQFTVWSSWTVLLNIYLLRNIYSSPWTLRLELEWYFSLRSE